MAVKYFKRYRMEIDLAHFAPPEGPMPLGYSLVPWSTALSDIHAETKYLSFRTEIDANVFPCLGDADGCRRLMREISRKDGFLPQATWLAAYEAAPGERTEYCGTVQGIRDRSGFGAIQNLGIVPEHRDRQLGTILLAAALRGFANAGLRRAYLEVTALNEGAIRLYRRLGFHCSRTVYKAAEPSRANLLAREPV